MSGYLGKDSKDAGDAPKEHRIRITLTSRKVKSLEKVCKELIERARSKDLRVKGPVRLPTKNLRISTRKTPNGEGSKTWDSYEMRIHKRLIEYVPLLSTLPIIIYPDINLGRKEDGRLLTRRKFSLQAGTEVVKQIIINIEAGVEVNHRSIQFKYHLS
ncbi:40S ribosomal protein S20, variant 2 [Orbilia oligospora]|nr:40S ribosomal protein S20, variant 2 [Orbilia oligospora]KAF3251944.1 40S ribosomal protein S20, variant 2 [Orbilia oligospora]